VTQRRGSQAGLGAGRRWQSPRAATARHRRHHRRPAAPCLSPRLRSRLRPCADGPDAGLDKYSLRDVKRLRTRDPLTSVMTLTAEYFPEELFGGDKRCVAHACRVGVGVASWE
jgi:hypothetical protein